MTTEVGTIGACSNGVPRRRARTSATAAAVVGGEIDFRQRDHGAPNAEIGEDLQVLLGLRHPAVVRRDDEQRHVHRADARNHVLDEILVPRHIDDAERRCPWRRRPGQREVREAEVDGDAARLFLRQPVGIGAGQGADERALAVIDVPGGGDDEMPRPSFKP